MRPKRSCSVGVFDSRLAPGRTNPRASALSPRSSAASLSVVGEHEPLELWLGAAGVRQTGGSQDIYVVPIEGGTPQRVNVLYSWRRVIDIKWSSEGDRLAIFAETSQGRRFVIVSLWDACARELDTDTPRGTWFDWSPDGRWIVFQHKSNESYVLHEVSSGEDRRILADIQGEQIQAMFSPDGMELVGNNIGLASPGLWVVAIDGGTPRLVTAEASGRNYPVHWSREGIIYVLGTDGTIFHVVQRAAPHDRSPASP